MHVPLIGCLQFVYFILHYVNLIVRFGNHAKNLHFKDKSKKLSAISNARNKNVMYGVHKNGSHNYLYVRLAIIIV